ncbi:hypothetical protein BGZ82_006237 [Podila clonocystis]|nr:hypothetical protein BGZ82_006237 [Podila clonocystis]
MATFHSLSPPLGSHQNRNAPDQFSIQLELALPQDHFLPAEGIQAQVWTNLIHQRNPEGPEVWAAIPMKLSQVIPGSSIAVFTARLMPTGRGDFGLTCRWKSHKDQEDWTWATKTGGEEENLTITVRVPRSISATSSWTLGPQSVLIYGANGPRQDGGRGVGGPGLYLGNHAAATRARISGYESVLSLVGDLLDFDEKIPESDKDVNKKAWLEQQATQKAALGGSLSRSNSLSGFGSNLSLVDLQGEDKLSLSRRTSVGDFMVNYVPGVSSNSAVDIYSVIDEPVDPPRLTRRNSVTEMMVQPPSQASKRAMRVSASISSITSIGELDQDQELLTTPSKESAPAAVTKSTAPPSLNVNNTPKNAHATPPVSQGKKTTTATAAAAATAAVPPPLGTGAAPPLSKKEKKAAAVAATASASSPASTTTAPAAASTTPGTALSPPSTNKTMPRKVVPQTPTETVPSLAVSTAPTKAEETASTGTQDPQPQPPSSAKVISGLYRQTWDTQATLTSLNSHANGSTNPLSSNGRPNSQGSESGAKAKPAFQHKVISLAPGAHNRISEAILREAVGFLHKEISQGKKVLVHCRDGNGRSGSIALAYIAAQAQKLNQEKSRPNQSKGDIYNQSLQEVWKWKCDVYPHRGLRSTMETMEWSL